MSYASSEQLRRVERSQNRFVSPHLALLLMARARQQLHHSAAGAEHLARLAEAVSSRASPPAVRALAAAEHANAYRAMGLLKQADEGMAAARWFGSLSSLHPLVEAELACLEGSLRRDQRRLSAALEHLEVAARLFEEHGDSRGLVRASLKLVDVLRFSGKLREALDLSWRTLWLIEPHREPRTHLIVLHNLATYLNEDGRASEAAELLRIAAPLYERHAARPLRIRRLWLAGRIERARGCFDSAESSFSQALQEFFDEGLVLFSAMVALDLAELYLVQDRRYELRALAGTIPPIFRSERLHREATAALKMLHDVAARNILDLEVLATIRSRLENAPAAPLADPQAGSEA